MNALPDKRFGQWIRLACVVVSCIALWLVFRRVSIGALATPLLRLRFGWFLAAILLFVTALVLAAFRWHLMLRLSGLAVHAGATNRTVLIGHFFNTLLFGPTGGDLAKSALYSRWYRRPFADTLASSFLDRLLGLGGLVLFIFVALGLAVTNQGFAILNQMHVAVSRRWLVIGLAASAMLGIAMIKRRRRKPDSFLFRALNAFFVGFRRLAGSSRVAMQGLILGLLVQATMTGVLALCLQAVSENSIPWRSLLWTFPVISVLASLPITIGGSGLREGAALVFLGFYGIPAADAVTASMLTFVVLLVGAGFGGILWWREEKEFGKRCDTRNPQSISVIIPTLNEAEALAETVSRAWRIPEVSEVIVVDGGSRDDTIAIAEKMRCRTFSSASGRGGQMRHGAARAAGDVILLLHADTWLPPEAGRAVLDCLRDVTVVGGGFWKTFRNPTWVMLGSRLRCGLRLLFCRRVMGDQALFVRREVLEKIGGVPEIPLMEEFELCRKLRVVGRLALACATVTTSNRRFTRLGPLRTYARMWRVTLQYHLGTSPQELARIYEKD
jgi:rSAM/selenodomain-associated transferase 2